MKKVRIRLLALDFVNLRNFEWLGMTLDPDFPMSAICLLDHMETDCLLYGNMYWFGFEGLRFDCNGETVALSKAYVIMP